MLNSTAEFTVTAGGNRPLFYQWRFTDTNLPGATNSVLRLTNVQLHHAGTYAVEVSNALGSVLSSNATLTVLTPPANVAIPNTNTPSGWPVTVPVLLVANGNENAFSCSVYFGLQARTPLLRYAGTALGPAAPGASLVVNTNLLASGLLGLAVALPAGNTFVPGTQEVARITFETEVLTSSQTTAQMLTFVDNPILRQVTDVLANSLTAIFLSGRVVLLPSDVEGDTAPRPDGNRSLTLNDWVQAGRFAAGLDVPASGGEFQRADCAPRETHGDGLIKVTDWVQSGRYFGKLDPLMAVGGPTSAAPGKQASKNNPFDGPGTRLVQASNVSAVLGVAVEVPVWLEAEGNENALGFSLAYDPARLQYMTTVAGADAVGASLNLNPAHPGKLGLVLALPLGASFPAGTREIARIHFTVIASTAADVALGFVDAPVLRAVSDAMASELSSDYLPGVLHVRLPPELRINIVGAEAILAWPAWARDFNLQAASNPLLSPGTWTTVIASPAPNGTELFLKVPLTNDTQFFRLRHR